MTDVHSTEIRSYNMSRIKGKNTKPEMGSLKEAVSKVIDPVILNLFQDPNALYIRSRNKFGMTKIANVLTFDIVSKG